MQAIVVKHLGPTNTRGSRLKASCAAGSVTISYPHEVNHNETHWEAAKALLIKLGWTKDRGFPEMVEGGLPDGSTVFVFTKGARYHA